MSLTLIRMIRMSHKQCHQVYFIVSNVKTCFIEECALSTDLKSKVLQINSKKHHEARARLAKKSTCSKKKAITSPEKYPGNNLRQK